MKYFIVNVNNCLAMSQYEPFFYEHIYKGDLVMLDDIADTCQLEQTYQQLLSHLNRNPFSYRQSVILLFIPRDFSLPLRPQDYELYNDINTYLHLLRNLSSDFKVYTFYVDRTGELEQNDAIYQKLKHVNHTLQADRPELESHFLSIPQGDLPQQGRYTEYLCSRINLLSGCTQPFYLYMLDRVSDFNADATMFQSAINNYIGQARSCLSQVNHIYAPIYRLELSKEIEEWLKVIYYIKDMIEQHRLPEEMPKYDQYVFTRYDHVRQLLATYRKRLSIWACSTPPLPRQETSALWEFRMSGNAAAEYSNKVESIINHQLKSVSGSNIHSQSEVDTIFAQLNLIITDAWGSLQDFTAKQSKLLLDPNNYQPVTEENFNPEAPDREDARSEAQALQQTNLHDPDAAQIPDFSAENRLEQELEQNKHQIRQILANLDVYRFGAFAAALVFALLAVAGLYALAQYSIFIKEHTWWLYGLYLIANAAIFSTAYFTVRYRYMKEIDSLIGQCKTKVSNFLKTFQQIASDFEANTLAAGRYNCLKRQLDAKSAARDAYHTNMQKYAWHKMKVDKILRNLTFFDSFVGNAAPYEEGIITLDNYDHDPEHTEFYLMKVFRR